MDEETLDEPRGLSRRSALTRIGAGAAVIWSAPTLLSIGASASAASGVPCNACSNNDIACDGLNACEGGCNCWVRADGAGNCCGVAVEFCSPSNACGAANSCPAGYTCVSTCCGNICVAPCGSGLGELGVGAASTGSTTR